MQNEILLMREQKDAYRLRRLEKGEALIWTPVELHMC